MKVFQFSNLSKISTLTHFISSRFGGVSKPPYDSLNLGYRTADTYENVVSNWKILSNKMKIESDSFVIAHQVHQGNVVVADENSSRGAWADPNKEIDQTDAFITSRKNICIVVKVADCVPILIYDPILHIAAAIHAGWRGTLKSVTSNTVRIMTNKFKSDPETLVAGIGPSIGPCCYEIGPEVEIAVNLKWGTEHSFITKLSDGSGKSFDLWKTNHSELVLLGVKPENIETAAVCTKCNSDMYFSARASGGITGRFVAGIMLK